jgi:hypothetical protein
LGQTFSIKKHFLFKWYYKSYKFYFMKGDIIMLDFTKEIKERAEKMGYEMKGLAEDMGNEMRSMGELMKAKAEKLSNEIKNRMTR